jgi:hypothetical protein
VDQGAAIEAALVAAASKRRPWATRESAGCAPLDIARQTVELHIWPDTEIDPDA